MSLRIVCDDKSATQTLNRVALKRLKLFVFIFLNIIPSQAGLFQIQTMNYKYKLRHDSKQKQLNKTKCYTGELNWSRHKLSRVLCPFSTSIVCSYKPFTHCPLLGRADYPKQTVHWWFTKSSLAAGADLKKIVLGWQRCDMGSVRGGNTKASPHV